MNREDIIAMAREAGIDEETPNVEVVYKSQWFSCIAEELERFAALVAAAERVVCAEVCIEQADDWRAQLDRNYVDACSDCAAAIRARSNT